MGLFDDVRCDVPLPDGFEGGRWGQFQTKTFPEPYMEKYTITREGRLLHQPSLKHEPTDTNYHGILNFYGGDTEGEWREYNAKFTDGQLVDIALVPNTDQR